MKLLLSWIILGFAVPAIAAPPSSKPAWKWTIEERLAARLDETARIRRVEAAEAQRLAHRGQTANRGPRPSGAVPAAPDTSRRTDVIRGFDHPEFLLPFEIFSVFTRAAYTSDDEIALSFRRDASAKAVALGLPADFLAALERQARSFIAFQRQDHALRQVLSTGKAHDYRGAMARVRELEELQCSSRAEAIRSLRLTFGERFDKFLYLAIAPGVSRDFDAPVSAERLRREEKGCH